MWPWLRDFVFSWWDRLVASDAGLIRFTSAARVTVSVILTFVVIDALSRVTPLPMAMIVMGIIESLFGSVAVRDPSPAKQRLTLLLTPLPAAAALTLGTTLAPWRAIGDVGFLVVIFAATYARRFGPRATALGMLAYISYFIGLFLHLPFAQLPYQILALAIGTASAYLVRFALIRDRPERTLSHVLASFSRRLDQILDEIDQGMAAGGWDNARRRRLRHRVTQLNETALVAEGQIEALDPDRLAPASRRSVFGSRLFDLEIAAGRLAHESVLALPSPTERAVLRRVLGGLKRRTSVAPARARNWLHRLSVYAGHRLPAGDPITHAVQDVAEALAAMPGPESAAEPAPAEQQDGADSPAPDIEKSRLLPTTRAAIQVSLACALAIVPGEFLSPQRWYWAVITVFVMFTGTQSRGDVLAKGTQRAMGTLVGVGAGILVATAASGHYAISLALIFGCVFLAFYLVQVAYGLMIFWITILISLLYGLLGYFSPALLILRVEETGIGAFIGVLVAMVVLPTSSRENFILGTRSFLRALGDLVGHAAQPGGMDLTEAARELDRRFYQLRTTGKPLTSGLAGAFAPSRARRWLRVFLACDYYARTLAGRAQREGAVGDQTEECQRLAARIRANIDRILGVLDRTRPKSVLSGNADPDVPARSLGLARERTRKVGMPDSGQYALIHALAGIDEAIWLLARDLAGPEELKS